MRSEREAEHFEKRASVKEKEALDRASELGLPRDEYREGRVKLSFSHVFSNGTELSVSEDDNGIARVVFRKDNEIIFDLDRILPDGFKLATPSYLQTKDSVLDEEKEKSGFWRACFDSKVISMGDWRKPQEIFILLHEIGHTHQGALHEKLFEGKPTTRSVYDEQKFTAEVDSSLERDAWAYAVKAARHFRELLGIDFFELFNSKEELFAVIYGALLSLKYHHEFNQKEILEEQKILDKFIELILDDKSNYLKKLFDKGHLKQ